MQHTFAIKYQLICAHAFGARIARECQIAYASVVWDEAPLKHVSLVQIILSDIKDPNPFKIPTYSPCFLQASEIDVKSYVP